ncbi:hypothetical protein CUMW_127510, partial [Citrus unshiu]
ESQRRGEESEGDAITRVESGRIVDSRPRDLHYFPLSRFIIRYWTMPFSSYLSKFHLYLPRSHGSQDVEQLFEIHRRMDHSELRHTLVGLDVGNGYVIYSVKQKLKQEQLGLPGDEIKKLKSPDTGVFFVLDEM